MIKEATYKEKFTLLKNWMPEILNSVKKDLKSDHLKKDFAFAKKYFTGKNPAKLTLEELVEGYNLAIDQEEKAEELAEFITNRWLLKNSEVYNFYERELSQINKDFTSLDHIEEALAQKIVQQSLLQFGAIKSYIFATLNSVVFPKKVFETLERQAYLEKEQSKEEESLEDKEKSLEEIMKRHEEEINKLTNKYEDKLQGLQNKYIRDVEMLKKQIANLQRKAHGPK